MLRDSDRMRNKKKEQLLLMKKMEREDRDTINTCRFVLFLSTIPDQCVHYQAARYACGYPTLTHILIHTVPPHLFCPNDVKHTL